MPAAAPVEVAERVYPERKQLYVNKLKELFTTYKTILLVDADFVGSSQMQQVRLSLRDNPKAEILMGKNTMVRQVIRSLGQEKPGLQALLAKKVGEPGFKYLFGNVGLVFTNDDPKQVRAKILENKVPAAAKAGVFAPKSVVIPGGVTTLDPGQTQFFQVLNIPTKINRGAIEILADVEIIKEGQKVGASEVALLAKMNILPFHYGLKPTWVYEDSAEGTIYDAKVLDLATEDLLAKFFNGVTKLACISLALSYPTAASLPHLVSGAFKKLLAISVATEYSFPQADKFKEMLKNPGAYVVAAPAAGAAPAAAAKVEEKPAEEEEADMGFSLFD